MGPPVSPKAAEVVFCVLWEGVEVGFCEKTAESEEEGFGLGGFFAKPSQGESLGEEQKGEFIGFITECLSQRLVKSLVFAMDFCGLADPLCFFLHAIMGGCCE